MTWRFRLWFLTLFIVVLWIASKAYVALAGGTKGTVAFLGVFAVAAFIYVGYAFVSVYGWTLPNLRSRW